MLFLFFFSFFKMAAQTLALSPQEGQEEPVEHMLMVAGQDDCPWAGLPKESLTQGVFQPCCSCSQTPGAAEPSASGGCFPTGEGITQHQAAPGGFRTRHCSVGGSSAPAWCGK